MGYVKEKEGAKAEFIINPTSSESEYSELDIVVSHDTLTMLSDVSIKAYHKVNNENSLNDPKFITYKEYKKNLNFIYPSA